MRFLSLFFFFFFNDTATTEIYTLSLHDALPISYLAHAAEPWRLPDAAALPRFPVRFRTDRSEEHTSELQSLAYLVCRLLLEKKKKHQPQYRTPRDPTNRDADAPVAPV